MRGWDFHQNLPVKYRDYDKVVDHPRRILRLYRSDLSICFSNYFYRKGRGYLCCRFASYVYVAYVKSVSVYLSAEMALSTN